jgi:hypothetical protein
MLDRKQLIERARQLADSGTVAHIDQLIVELKREGYDGAEYYIAGHRSDRQALNRRCRAAWAQAGNAPAPSCYRSIGRLRAR